MHVVGDGDHPAASLTVDYDGLSYDVPPGGRLTFGRGRLCDIRLGQQPDGSFDPLLRSDAGYFEALGPVWWVWATYSHLQVNDDLGAVITVPKGRSTSLLRPHLAVMVHGRREYVLDVRYPEEAIPWSVSRLPHSFEEVDPMETGRPLFSTRQKLALVAVLAPMLNGAESSNSYRAAAALLRRGGDGTWQEKLVERLWSESVRKGHEAGFPGLKRETGLAELSSHRVMFRELTKRGLLTKDDLHLLP
ncbi:MAG: hypothetical protein QOI56_473 [Actinomycetota bacterium]|nr:hypothetical protein [Actinomycetota bacterium]